MWVEVGSQFARRWRAFFERLEEDHHLNPKDPHHLWLLHYLFLSQIQHDAKMFQEDWNLHPISGHNTGNKSPAVSSTSNQTPIKIFSFIIRIYGCAVRLLKDSI